LRWIVEGCLAYQTEGLGEPQEVKDATQDYRSEQDVLAAFVEERCVLHPKASIGTTPLYEAYKAWCEETGEGQLTQTKFGLRLKERGFRKEKVGTVTWYGLGLVSNLPDPDEPGGFRDDSPEGESPIGKGDTTHSVGDPGGFGPKNNINTPISLRVGVIPEKGPNPPNRPQPSTEDDGDDGRFGPSFDSQHPPIGPAGNGGNTVSGGRLTPEEADRVKRRIHEGMKPDIARAEVLAKRGKGGGAA
jgi:hypothetical protein